MVFNNNESLAALYEGITKRIDPSTQQATRQSPTLSKTDLSKDQDLLAEAYKTVGKKCICVSNGGDCECDDCEECKANQKPVEEGKKPAFLYKKDKEGKKEDKEKDKKKPFPFKKKEMKMKEGLNFKDMFAAVMNESKKQEMVCGTKINPQFQYKCVMKDGTKTTLKGSSVLQKSDELKSVEAAHKK
jgi:hypothetical protein